MRWYWTLAFSLVTPQPSAAIERNNVLPTLLSAFGVRTCANQNPLLRNTLGRLGTGTVTGAPPPGGVMIRTLTSGDLGGEHRPIGGLADPEDLRGHDVRRLGGEGA